MARKNWRKKEEIAEDYCFICKDGGLLIVCEYKDCLEVYHPHCTGRDDSSVKTVDHWTCYVPAYKKRKVLYFSIDDAEFACVRGKKGFCNHCLILAQLIEENIDVDFDVGKIDFKDRDTNEGLFKEYWEIIKEKEGLTSKHVHSTDKLLKKNKKYMAGYDSMKLEKGKKAKTMINLTMKVTLYHLIVTDYEDLDYIVENKAVGKRKRS
nr:zinc finger ccch domain-containing protein 19 [Quercus suber]